MFHIGQPVLIINGPDARHRAHIGKGTTVESRYIEGVHIGTGAPVAGYMVGLSRCDDFGIGFATDYLYRHNDLMPIDPLNDETTTDTKEVTTHGQAKEKVKIPIERIRGNLRRSDIGRFTTCPRRFGSPRTPRDNSRCHHVLAGREV